MVAEAGARAIATGSAEVAVAHGHDNAEGLPLDLALANADRMVGAVAQNGVWHQLAKEGAFARASLGSGIEAGMKPLTLSRC